MYSPLSNWFARPRSKPPPVSGRFTASARHSSSVLPFSDQSFASNSPSSGPSPGESSTSFECFPASPAQILTSPAPAGHTATLFPLNVPLESSSYVECASAPSPATWRPSSLRLSGDLLFSATSPGDVTVSSHLSLTPFATFGVGSSPVTCLHVTPSSVFSAHEDLKIRIWRRRGAKSGFKLVATLPSVKDFLLNAIAEKNYVQIRRHHRRIWIQHVDNISALAADSDERYLYSASWDRTLKIWKLPSMRCVQSIKAHEDAVNDMVLNEAEDMVYTASADGSIRMWRRVGERRVLACSWTAHKSAINALALRGDGRVMYSAGSDCCINVWIRETVPSDGVKDAGRRWKLSATLKGHRQAVLCLSASGPLLCSGSADKTIRVWRRYSSVSGDGDLQEYFRHSCVAVLQGHEAPVKSVCLSVRSMTSCFVNSGGLDNTTRVWSVLFDRERL